MNKLGKMISIPGSLLSKKHPLNWELWKNYNLYNKFKLLTEYSKILYGKLVQIKFEWILLLKLLNILV